MSERCKKILELCTKNDAYSPTTSNDFPTTSKDCPTRSNYFTSTRKYFTTSVDCPTTSENCPTTSKDYPETSGDSPTRTEDCPVSTEDSPMDTTVQTLSNPKPTWFMDDILGETNALDPYVPHFPDQIEENTADEIQCRRKLVFREPNSSAQGHSQPTDNDAPNTSHPLLEDSVCLEDTDSEDDATTLLDNGVRCDNVAATSTPSSGVLAVIASFDEDGTLNSSEGTPACTAKKPTRKRPRNPEAWKISKIKEARNLGLPYFNSAGKPISGVKMGLPCVCNQKCRLRVSQDERLAIHRTYWSLGNKTRQWDFITRHSTSALVKQRTTNGNSRRNFSRKYFFEIGPMKSRIPVCKVMFRNTLGIGDGVIQSAHEHAANGTLSPDKRGRHQNRPRTTTEEQKASIRAHIDLYPRVPPHYVRARSKREYVECGLTISKMFSHYQQWCEAQSVSVTARASCRQYRTIFNTEYNIGFFKPKKDLCSLCQIVKKGTKTEKEQYKARWIEHINNKQAARKEKTNAKNLATKRSDIAVCVFDLQKVLPCPKSETSLFFYKNKLSVFNLTVYDLVEHLGTCYVWNEAIAKRGADEISSCFLDFTETCAKNGKVEIRSFSDSCAGQNKNRFFYAMLIYACMLYKLQIKHCFLEPGHTQNEGDSVHARIECAAQGKEIFDMNEWIDLIKSAKQEKPNYLVKLLKRTAVFNFHDLVGKQNWEKDVNGKKITWCKVKIVQADYRLPGMLMFKYDYEGNDYYLNTNQFIENPINLENYIPPLSHKTKIPLKKNTVEHLQWLCKKLAIPSKYHDFYNNIINSVEPHDEDHDDDIQVEIDSADPDEPKFESDRDDESVEDRQA